MEKWRDRDSHVNNIQETRWTLYESDQMMKNENTSSEKRLSSSSCVTLSLQNIILYRVSFRVRSLNQTRSQEKQHRDGLCFEDKIDNIKAEIFSYHLVRCYLFREFFQPV
jgi:hypothetical protein